MSTEASNRIGETTLQQIFDSFEGLHLRETHNGLFHFPLHLTKSMSDTSIDALELGVRSYHCLKRADLNTIGELAEFIASGKPLKNVRNCGTKSVREIMEKLFMYQYNLIKPEKCDDYILEVIALNIRPDNLLK